MPVWSKRQIAALGPHNWWRSETCSDTTPGAARQRFARRRELSAAAGQPAALRCLGGELQAQLWPTTRTEIEQAREAGIEDTARVFTTEELAPGEVIVVATGVSNGDLLRGVRFLADSARTHSLVMCTRCNWVRFVDGIHFFVRERREEVRLLGQ